MPTPEQKARARIDELLLKAGWVVQDREEMNLSAGAGVAVREYPLPVGPCDYLLVVDGKAAGVVEAKPEGTTLTGVAEQAETYMRPVPEHLAAFGPNLLFDYESTGTETLFRDVRDPDARSRHVFAFHRPETLFERATAPDTLRRRLQSLPTLDPTGLRQCQIEAIAGVGELAGLEKALARGDPRALVQMATGAGKTYLACTFVYRLIKYAGARRVLFLVDRNNLGDQALREFQHYVPPDDPRRFTALYVVQHLKTNTIDKDAKVVITTIQRLYAMLRGEELAVEAEEHSAFESGVNGPPKEVVYTPRVPIETFDFIVTDECHRSIYGQWRQVLDYFDAFTIGLTATPSLHTLGFFNRNLVAEYPYERSVIDGVNVSFEVFRRGTPPDAIYTFKHALVQDAAYQSLLKSRRQQLHGRIAQVLQEQLPAIAETRPELLAHHSAAAGLAEDAVAWWARAARQSAARSAMAEAVAQARSGLELIARLPDNAGSALKKLELQSVLAAALVATVGNAAAATGQAYARARVLCEQLGDTTTLVPVLSGLSTYHQTRSEFQALRQTSAELLRLGHERGDTASEVVGHRSMALCLYHLGEFRSAQEHIERVLELYLPGAHHPLTSIAAFDMRAAALSYLSLSLLILGHPEQARHWSEQALIWSRSLQHPHTLAFSLNYAGYFHLLGRAGAPVEDVLEELRLLAVEQRFPIWLAGADIMGGYVLAGRGEATEGLRVAREGLTERRATGSSWHETHLLSLLAQIAHGAGQPDEARSLLDTALAMADRTGERWYEAELHRLKGELLLALSHRDQAAAEGCFQHAAAVARGQGARSWELRAATSLARLWADQGRRAEAHDLLAPIYGWFTEGFETPDLKDAQALLDELA